MNTENQINAYEVITVGLQNEQGLLGFAAYLNRNGHQLIISNHGPSVIIKGYRLSVRACGLMPDFITMMCRSKGPIPDFDDGSRSAEILAARLTWIGCSKFSEDIPELSEPLRLYLEWLPLVVIDQAITSIFWEMGHAPKEERVKILHRFLVPEAQFAMIARQAQKSVGAAVEKPKRKRSSSPRAELVRYAKLMQKL